MESRVDDAPDALSTSRSLNALLASLEIPLVLQSPLELTPSLILTIFESMLRTYLPISEETRKCRTYAARVEAMKIFIGVLEDDVLGIDVGLGDIDPRRLADGKREEVRRIADVLCWLGKRMNYVSQDGLSVGNIARSRDGMAKGGGTTRADSPSMLSVMSASQDSSLLMHSTHSFDDSQTTITSLEVPDDESQGTLDEESFSILGQTPLLPRDGRDFLFTEHAHLHEVDGDPDSTIELPTRFLRQPSRRYDFDSEEEGDIEGSDSYCHCNEELSKNLSAAAPVRTAGCLETMDFDDELRLYELRRRNKSTDLSDHRHGRHTPLRSSAAPSRTPQSSSGIITRHTSPAEYTLALLDERAKLLSELSRLRRNRD